MSGHRSGRTSSPPVGREFRASVHSVLPCPATVTCMQPVPRWAMLSATAAPVLLIGGWTVAAARQPAGFNSVRDTISALAAIGATDRWIMTAALGGLGLCHVVTAIGLRSAALPGRVVLVIGGLANIAVAAFPQPEGGSSPAHVWAAAVGFVALAVWPALAWRRDRPAPFGLLLPVALTAAAVLVALICWFASELYGEGNYVGLSERMAAGAEAFWPLVVVISARRKATAGG